MTREILQLPIRAVEPGRPQRRRQPGRPHAPDGPLPALDPGTRRTMGSDVPRPVVRVRSCCGRVARPLVRRPLSVPLDAWLAKGSDSRLVAEAERRKRVFIEDSRANGRYLRTTWHPDGNQFVISTWDKTVCTGAVRVPVAQAGELIGLLAEGLSDAASAVPLASAETARQQRSTLWDRARRALLRVKAHRATSERRTQSDASVMRLPEREVG